MKLACPACGAVYSLEVLITNDAAREAVMAALALPAPLGKLLVQYVALFRPAQRQLSFDRVARILDELRGPISEAKIERNGRIWPAPQASWAAAISEMIALRDAQKLRLPLASHGYLFEIIAGQADKIAAAAERDREKKLRGETPVGGAPSPAGEGPGVRVTSVGEGPGVRASTSRPGSGSRMPQSFKETVAALGFPTARKESPPDEKQAPDADPV